MHPLHEGSVNQSEEAILSVRVILGEPANHVFQYALIRLTRVQGPSAGMAQVPAERVLPTA
jgi:hypothetical protein